MYLDPGRRYVGQGTLHNDLSDRILRGVPLEDEFVRVQFEVAEKSEYDAPLPRPCVMRPILLDKLLDIFLHGHAKMSPPNLRSNVFSKLFFYK